MKSIKLKVVMIYLMLVFIVMIVSGTFMLTSLKILETEKYKQELEEYNNIVEKEIINKYPVSEFQDGFNNLNSVVGTPDIPIQSNIIGISGKTIASNTYKTNNKPTFINSTIISAMSGEASFGTDKAIDVDGTSKNWINYSTPVFDEYGNVQYVIFSRVDQSPILETLLQFSITLLITLILSLIMTAILGLAFANTLTEPIINLTIMSKKIAAGNLDQKIPVNSNDEIGQLTESFNDMTQNLNNTINLMISEKNKLEILLDNINDGVIAYDAQENIIHANDCFYELLGLNKNSDIKFKTIMNTFGIDIANIYELLKLDVKDPLFFIKDRYLSINLSTYLNSNLEPNGILILLKDITQHKKLDDMRKEFVANVSHEIRTPLTNIKSYTETLMYGAINEPTIAIDFLSIIDSEADRMTLLVKDLLELSKFDNKNLLLDIYNMDLIEILKLCLKQNLISANKKNQKIILELPKTECLIMGDKKRLNQVFTNILNNAIKYSEENTNINISLKETSRYYVVSIKDNGIGIPTENLKDIFERFYRVDKARSRSMGGTGLGLAIAKEIMDLHNAIIYAKSTLNEGTTIILKFLKL